MELAVSDATVETGGSVSWEAELLGLPEHAGKTNTRVIAIRIMINFVNITMEPPHIVNILVSQLNITFTKISISYIKSLLSLN
jgi:hypothetical protein